MPGPVTTSDTTTAAPKPKTNRIELRLAHGYFPHEPLHPLRSIPVVHEISFHLVDTFSKLRHELSHRSSIAGALWDTYALDVELDLVRGVYECRDGTFEDLAVQTSVEARDVRVLWAVVSTSRLIDRGAADREHIWDLEDQVARYKEMLRYDTGWGRT